MNIPALLTAIAALLSAIAWPVALLIVLLVYRKSVGSAVAKLPAMFDRVQSLKLGALEAELERVALVSDDSAPKGAVTSEQVRVAAKIESQAADLGTQALFRQLDRLCIEYDTIRDTMPSGYARTSAMTHVLIKMRTLAPSTSSMIDAYKWSGSPGSRLAAIAMMQMNPELADLAWLEERFKVESPFVFYHAALAMKNMTIQADPKTKERIIEAAWRARLVVEGFGSGVPDPDTIEVLSSIV
jgi:hypothetical protein